MHNKKTFNKTIRIILTLALVGIIFFPFAFVQAGERGVLMYFGRVEDKIVNGGDLKFDFSQFMK